MRYLGLIAIFTAALSASQAVAEEIHLACSGASTRTRTNFSAGISGSNGQGGYISGGAEGTEQVQRPDEVYVDIINGEGRIKLPTSMVPIIASRSDDGWRAFESLNVGADNIEGKVNLNFINHPKVSISRLTGHIDIATLKSTFAGQCEPYDPKTVTRKF